jgi:prepilin-type N-terminal cleavage/methylation domain-containing protein
MPRFAKKALSRWQDNRGFTIGEILVVTAIFGILAAVAVPQFVALQPTLRLNGAARQVFSELMSARMKAVNENTTYTVTFPNNHTLQIVGSSTRTVDIQTLYEGVTLTSTAATINLSARGTADVSSTITVTNTSGSKTVSVKITGTATIS